jgi:excisionase family DNA binding protein
VSRAYTVASLAEEWECSEGVIRKAIANGELGCFRLGTLIRIPVEEVRRFECQNIASSDCEADMPSSGETRMESATDGSSKPKIAIPRKRKHATCGSKLPIQQQRLAG